MATKRDNYMGGRGGGRGGGGGGGGGRGGGGGGGGRGGTCIYIFFFRESIRRL